MTAIMRPPAADPLDQRTIAALRLLGRLEFVQTPILRRLVYRDIPERTMYHSLDALLAQGLVWRTDVRWQSLPGPARAGRRQPPPRLPHIWGLTPRGRDLLATLEIEHDDLALQGLRTHHPRDQVSTITLRHDLVAAWWCAALLDALRMHPWLRSIFCQVEFVSHERQRIDALMLVRLCPDRPRPSADLTGDIPWFAGESRQPGEIELRWALEVDRGTESLPILMEKAVTYRDLHADGIYTRLLGGPVLPVFLVPDSVRAGKIAREWQTGWHDGWGVIAPLEQADDADAGPLWGTYRSMRAGEKGAALPLLSRLRVTELGAVVTAPPPPRAAWQAAHPPEEPT